MVKRLFPVLFLLVSAGFLMGENQISAEIQLLDSFTQNPLDDSWTSAGAAVGGLSFTSVNNSKVRAELAVDAAVTAETALFSVPRAYVKVRFPEFRLTAGKTFLSWGQGLGFNAGDLMAPNYSLAASLSSEAVRDQSLWLTSVYYSLGRTSFLEGVVLLPMVSLLSSSPDLAAMLSGMGISASEQETSFGIRYYGKLGSAVTEAGYLFDLDDKTHHAELSVQGNFFFDVYGSVSTAYSHDDSHEFSDQVYRDLKISTGLFNMFSLPADQSISLRIEAQMQPESSYYPLVYPDISWTITSALSLSTRLLIQTEDLSSMFFASLYWKMTQGLSFFGMFSCGLGEEGDSYSLESVPPSIVVGLKYLY